MSTLAVSIVEEVPTPTVTPTPTSTPTATPTSTGTPTAVPDPLGLAPWDPGEPAAVAARTVVVAYRTVVSVVIWAGVLIAAFGAPVLIAAWLWRRRPR